MNRLRRFGAALYTVGLTGAGISFFVLMSTYAMPDLFWWAIGACAVCGVIAGAGYVIRHTFADPPRRSKRVEADEPEGGR